MWSICTVFWYGQYSDLSWNLRLRVCVCVCVCGCRNHDRTCSTSRDTICSICRGLIKSDASNALASAIVCSGLIDFNHTRPLRPTVTSNLKWRPNISIRGEFLTSSLYQKEQTWRRCEPTSSQWKQLKMKIKWKQEVNWETSSRMRCW